MNTAMMRYGRAAALVLVGAPIMGMPGSSQAQNAGPSQAQKALKIVMVPKFTGTAYFAATEKGAKEAVAELKGKGVAIDFLYTGPSVPNTDEEIRMIDDLPLIEGRHEFTRVVQSICELQSWQNVAGIQTTSEVERPGRSRSE